jgi:hypothetical protein
VPELATATARERGRRLEIPVRDPWLANSQTSHKR